MNLCFNSLFIFLITIATYLFLDKRDSTAIILIILFLITLCIRFSNELKIKTIKHKNLELEFQSIEEKQIINISFELLSKNFPKLTKVAQKEVDKRAELFIKDFLINLKDAKISIENNKVFYDPGFQFVLNKSIELAARNNNELQKQALILFLINRIKYSKTNREDLIYQIDSTIVNDIPKLAESHFKLLCLVKLLEDIKIILPNVVDIQTFDKYVFPAIEVFLIDDARCYEDLQKTNFIHNGGNLKLMFPQDEQREQVLSQDTKKIKPMMYKMNLWEYFVDTYPFLKDITKEEKMNIVNKSAYKKCDILFQRVLIHVQLLPFATNLISKYGLIKLQKIGIYEDIDITGKKEVC